MLKISLLRNLETSRVNNSRILRIKNAKFSGHCFYMNTKIQGDFQICISVPLTFNFYDREGLNFLTRLRLGLNLLGDHKFRHNFQDCVCSICTYAQDIESTMHILFQYPNRYLEKKSFFDMRNKLVETSQNIVVPEQQKPC